MSGQSGPPCGDCNGAGGRVVDTSTADVTRHNWQTCTTCKGSGVQAGGPR